MSKYKKRGLGFLTTVGPQWHESLNSFKVSCTRKRRGGVVNTPPIKACVFKEDV